MVSQESTVGIARVREGWRWLYRIQDQGSEVFEQVDEGRMGNKVWQAFDSGTKGHRRALPSKESERITESAGICSHDQSKERRNQGWQAIRSATKEDSQEDIKDEVIT